MDKPIFKHARDDICQRLVIPLSPKLLRTSSTSGSNVEESDRTNYLEVDPVLGGSNL